MVKSSLSFLGLLILAWGLYREQQHRRLSCEEYLSSDSFRMRQECFQGLRELSPLPLRCAWFYGNPGAKSPREAWVSQVSGVIFPSVCVIGSEGEWSRCGGILALPGYQGEIEAALSAAGENAENWTSVEIAGVTYVRRK